MAAHDWEPTNKYPIDEYLNKPIREIGMESIGGDSEPSYAIGRPDWGDPAQVTSAYQFEVGMVLEQMHRSKAVGRITVLELPSPGSPDEMRVSEDFPDSPGSFQRIAYLGDLGVVPYRSGVWNGDNYVRTVEDAPAA